jgi:hypothetical protein
VEQCPSSLNSSPSSSSLAESDAHTMATVTIAATEGAVVLSRADQSGGPFNEVASNLTDLILGKS